MSDLNINKDKFSNENFNSKEYLNNLLKQGIEGQSDLLSFKLKIIQREFSNDIDLNSNNVLKSGKTLENDLKIVNQFYSNIYKKVDSITNGKPETFITKKQELLVQENKNLEKSIKFIKNKKVKKNNKKFFQLKKYFF